MVIIHFGWSVTPMGFVDHWGCLINAESILRRSYLFINRLFKHIPLKWVITTICKLIQFHLFSFRDKSISCFIFHVNHVTLYCDSLNKPTVTAKRAVHSKVMRCEWSVGSKDASLANDVVSTLNQRAWRWIYVTRTSFASGNCFWENM